MPWTTSDIPDQTGRTAIVTGANGGLGLETARALAVAGAHVIMAARNLDKAERAKAEILAADSQASLEVRALDLASLESVRAFAGPVARVHPRLDLLVNNAGVMGTPRLETADGFEMQFGTNHLGHFALTALLMPALLHGPASRVVTVTSTGRHYGGRLRLDDPHHRTSYNPWRAYGLSKMANLRFAVELDRRLRAAGAATRSLVAHPGFSNTDLQAQSVRATAGGWSQRFFRRWVKRIGISPADGALPQLRAATDPDAEGGTLYTPRWVNNGSPVHRPILPISRRPKDMAALWKLSERETGVTFDVAAMVADGRHSD
jgi:NAD(P)-dependent dehydrogenase (short-subunit alcohol dehydrogenase family)